MNGVMTEEEQIVVALGEAIGASHRMGRAGVSLPHVGPAALTLVGLKLMEDAVHKSSMAAWLYKLADMYAAGDLSEDDDGEG